MEAREFSTSQAYAVGDLVIYGGRLYKFIAQHSAGAWNSAQATEVDDVLEQDLSRIFTAMDNAEKASDFANTVIFEPVNITGNRYKFELTNAPDPR